MKINTLAPDPGHHTARFHNWVSPFKRVETASVVRERVGLGKKAGKGRLSPSLSCVDQRRAEHSSSSRGEGPNQGADLSRRTRGQAGLLGRDKCSPVLQSPGQSGEERGGKELTLDSCC